MMKEAKVASEPEALVCFFKELGFSVKRIGLEAGPLSQWLHAGLAQAGFETVLLETRHVKAALSAMTVKTDRKDARGLAQLLRIHRRQFLHLAAGAAALPAVSGIAWLQAYPSRPVRIIVGYSAGGASDIVARLMAQWLSERLGQAFIVENRAYRFAPPVVRFRGRDEWRDGAAG
jgi:ferredoxin-NADP reductase